jgi:hypothetical protein
MKLNIAFTTRDGLREFWTDSPAQAPGQQSPPSESAVPVLEVLETRYEDMPTEVLRDMAARTGISRIGWHAWDRPMLIAFHRNRTLRRSQDAAFHE